MKNNIYEAIIEVTDRGVTSSQEQILNVLTKHLKKWRHASDWSAKFTFVIKKMYMVGEC